MRPRNAQSRLGALLASALAVSALGFGTAPVAAGPSGSATTIYRTAGETMGIAAGPDGNVWFTEFCCPSEAIGRITPGGAITEFPLQTGTGALSIATGPDGNLWFTESGFANFSTSAIGRISQAGTLTEFPLPAPFRFPRRITSGPDGNLWFTVFCACPPQIGRITTGGTFTFFPLPPDSAPEAIVAGPDGNLWFANGQGSIGNHIGRIAPTGAITQFALPTPSASPVGITAGPDGNIWFTESGAFGTSGGKIGRITPTGAVTEFPLGTSHSPTAITVGRDGNLWFTDAGVDMLGRITPAGAITEFADPAFTSLDWITAGPDGNLWFTLSVGGGFGEMGRFTLPAPDGSVGFDGRAAYVEAAGADLNLTHDWTVEAWFKDEDPQGFDHDYRQLVMKGDRDANPEAPYYLLVGRNNLIAGVRTGGQDYPISWNLAYLGLDPRLWHHVAVSFRADLNVLNLWLDGNHVGYLAVPAHSATGNQLPLQMGRNGPITGKYWLGKLDDIRIWNVARKGTEIAATYRTELTGPMPGLVANWRFDEGSGTLAADSSGNGHDATLHGALFFSDAHP